MTFIQQNKHASHQLQENIDEWVADRKRRYGILLSDAELAELEDHIAGLYPRLTHCLRK